MNTPNFEPDSDQVTQKITTELNWDDLVLAGEVRTLIEKVYVGIRNVQKHAVSSTEMRAGLRVLFSGLPGTGKTLTASLLGKGTGHDVYRVNLTEVISKYKDQFLYNLSMAFALAADKQWLLFFDGTEVLFGKQGFQYDVSIKIQIDKLLQYLEIYPGVVIISTTQADTTNATGLPLFDFTVNFPMPGIEERLQLWKNAFAGTISPDVNLLDLVENYEVTGGEILNVLRFCAIEKTKNGAELITLAPIKDGLQKELHNRH